MKKPKNQILVIFGASGDLTKRKLVPLFLNCIVKIYFQKNLQCWVLPEHPFQTKNSGKNW